jgi:1,2-diacylglycerol 3-beta-glucosyltransferase
MVPNRDRTLLIVEDDILPAMALRDELEDGGYRVLDLTGRHQEALAAARAEKPDLALVNIELQGRDDGIALAGELKAMGVPTLFISGQKSRASSARTVAIGSLPKPYRASDMLTAVDYLLAHLAGDESLPCPDGLEVFIPSRGQAEPDLV